MERQPTASGLSIPKLWTPDEQNARHEYIPGYVWNGKKAEHACRFIERFCRLPGDNRYGRPVTLLPWHRHEVFWPLLGWEHPDGRRRFRRGALFVPKKNTKSSLTSWLTTYFLTSDYPLCDVFGAATDREQARIIFNMVARSIRASPALSEVLEIVKSSSTIVNKEHGNVYRCLSSDSWRQEGLNGKIVVDEIHAHRTPDLVDALVYAIRATPNGLVFAISTAGAERAGVGWQWWQDCEIVDRDPAANPNFYGKIFAAKEGDDFSSPEVWRRANPCMGVVFPEDEFAADYKDALTHPRKMARFLRYSLNVWTTADNRWLTPEMWAQGDAEPEEPLEGRECWVGLDLAYAEDTSALVAIFPDEDGGVDVLARFYLPAEGMLERERRDRFDYSHYVEKGFIVATPGETTDYDFIRRDVDEFAKKYHVKRVAIDQWQAIQLGNQLQGLGLDVVKYKQGYAGFNAPCRLVENLLSKGRLRHAANPVLGFQATNVTLRQNAEGMVRPLKPKDTGGLRIDGMVSLLMAVGAWAHEVQTPARPAPTIHAI